LSEELRNEIKGRIKKFMKGKMDKARGLKLLKNEYNLPFAELSDLWLECKNSDCAREIDKVPVNTTPLEFYYKKIEDMGVAIVAKEPEKIVAPDRKNSLKVVKVTTEVEGEYGIYIKNNDGVKINGQLYSDIDAVKKEKVTLAAEYNTKMDGIREKIKALNDELKAIQDAGMKEIEKFTEIESVFGL
jgi:hypothetical protein